jgi:tRNA threonylcarbamoyladenosine biosynthesis protein TsaE
MKEIITNSFEETQELARKFIGDILSMSQKTGKTIILALEGDLGSGKTTFTQGLARGFGVKDNLASPTFVLIKEYKIRIVGKILRQKLHEARKGLLQGASFRSLFHIDCYRLNKPWQMQELGFEEIINNPQNIVVIEWPEKIAEILPEDAIKIKFEFIDENKRKIVFLS